MRKLGGVIVEPLQRLFPPSPVVKGEGPMFDAIFTRRKTVSVYRASIDVDKTVMRSFNDKLRQCGILKNDSKIYISLAHDDRDIAQGLEAFEDNAKLVAHELH